MTLDARQLGVNGTADVIRRLLVERFRLAKEIDAIPLNESLFNVGVGMTSIEGMELLSELEKMFGVEITDVEWWVYETPTVENAARFLIELTEKKHGSQRPGSA